MDNPTPPLTIRLPHGATVTTEGDTRPRKRKGLKLFNALYFTACAGQEGLKERFEQLTKAHSKTWEARHSLGHMRGQLHADDQPLDNKKRKPGDALSPQWARRRAFYEVERLRLLLAINHARVACDNLCSEACDYARHFGDFQHATKRMNVARCAQLLQTVLDDIKQHEDYLRKLPSYCEALDQELRQARTFYKLSEEATSPGMLELIESQLDQLPFFIYSTHPGETPMLSQVSGHYCDLLDAWTVVNQARNDLNSNFEGGLTGPESQLKGEQSLESRAYYEYNRLRLLGGVDELARRYNEARRSFKSMLEFVLGVRHAPNSAPSALVKAQIAAIKHDLACLAHLFVQVALTLSRFDEVQPALVNGDAAVRDMYMQGLDVLKAHSRASRKS